MECEKMFGRRISFVRDWGLWFLLRNLAWCSLILRLAGWLTDCGLRCLNLITVALWEQTRRHTLMHPHTKQANTQSIHTQSRCYCVPMNCWNTVTKKECVFVCILHECNIHRVCVFVHGCVSLYVCVFFHISRFSARWKRLPRPPSLHSCNSVTLQTVSLPHLYRRATLWNKTRPQELRVSQKLIF